MLFWLLFTSIVKASDIPMTLYSNDSVLNYMAEPKTDEAKIHFLTYSRNNPDHFIEIKLNKDSFHRSNLNFNKPFKIIIHGWISSGETTKAIETLKDALLNKTKCNIIVVDWHKLADGPYKSACKSSNTVATLLIEFIKHILANGVSSEDLHLIGHSIGAHIAGIAGKYFRDQNKIIDIIIGLDPAYPSYKFSSQDERLDREDARLVEVIHTNSGVWGYRTELGHIDFFPNGGRHQPGCMEDKRELCAHDRALLYYAYSIIGTKFVGIAFEQDDRVLYIPKKKMVMGGLTLKYGKIGSYWLRTGYRPPFVFDPNDDK